MEKYMIHLETEKKTFENVSLSKLKLKDSSPGSSLATIFPETHLFKKPFKSKTSRAELPKLKFFSQFLENCNNLQKDLNDVSSTLVKNIITNKKEINIDKFLKRKIRDKEYFEGQKKIEQRLRDRQEESIPKEIRSLKTMIMKNPTIDYSLAHEDVTSKRAKEFLVDNRRNFGMYFDGNSGGVERSKFKRKLSEIKINPEETIFEEFLYESAVIKPKRHRLSVPDLGRVEESPFAAKLKKVGEGENKMKLPALGITSGIAAKARMDANKFFTDRKKFVNRLNKKKIL